MSASFYDLLKYAKTGVASPSMTAYDKLKAVALCGGGFPVNTLTGVDSIDFLSDGTPLTSWTVQGNEQQKSANLFDINATDVDNGYIANRYIAYGGVIGNSTNHNVSEYINIPNNTEYITLSETQEASSIYAAFYDSEKNVLSSFSYATMPRTVSVPSGAKYIRLTVPKSSSYTTMLNTGSTALPYIPYDATPTPSAPIQPQETGDATGQLIPYPFYSRDGEYSGVQFTTYDGRIVANGTLTSGLLYYLWRPEKFPAGTYTMSVKGKHSGAVIYFRDATNRVTIASIQSSQTGDRGVTFTVTEEISVMVYLNAASGTIDFDCTIMLNEGSEALPFAPNAFKLPLTLGTTQNIYLSEPIRKIGDYADVASATGTSGVATRRIKKLVLTGGQGENWLSNTLPQSGVGFHINIQDMRKNERTNGYCTHFEAVGTPSGVTTDGITYGVSYGEAVTQTFMYISFSTATATALSISDVTTFKAWLAAQYANGTPVTVWYVLATATTETFTAPILTPANGNNTLTVDTTLPPSGVSITGKIKPI